MPVSCGFSGAPQARTLLVYHGPTLSVSIGLDPSWKKGQNRPPRPDRASITALIDTGAEESCFDSQLALDLGLMAIDRRAVCGVGSMIADVVQAQVYVEALKYTISGAFAVVPLVKNGGRQSVVLGRSFLRDCYLIYDGKTGDVSITLHTS